MSTGPARWQQRRRSARARRRRAVVHRCTVRRRWRGGYEVIVEGTDLALVGVVPRVRVGTETARLLRVTPEEIVGVLTTRPRAREVVVDDGVSRARGAATVRRRPALPGLVDLRRLLQAPPGRRRGGWGAEP